MPERRTGMTSRQLAALPDGAVFIVAHGPMACHCRHLLRESGRRHDALRLVIVADPQDVDRLRGTRRGTPWDIDHAFHAVAGRRGKVLAEAARLILNR